MPWHVHIHIHKHTCTLHIHMERRWCRERENSFKKRLVLPSQCCQDGREEAYLATPERCGVLKPCSEGLSGHVSSLEHKPGQAQHSKASFHTDSSHLSLTVSFSVRLGLSTLSLIHSSASGQLRSGNEIKMLLYSLEDTVPGSAALRLCFAVRVERM